MTTGQKAEPTRKNRRSWRRWLWLTGLCVVLGLVTSVGVAWGIVLFSEPNSSAAVEQGQGPAGVMRPEGEVKWIVEREAHGGWFRTTFRIGWPGGGVQFFGRVPDSFRDVFDRITNDRLCRAAMKRHAAVAHTAHAGAVMFNVRHVGWPALCLGAEESCNRERLQASPAWMYPNTPRNEPIDSAFDFAPHYNAIELGDHLLPIGPLWPGLFANTAIYGGAWAVLIFTPLGVRHWLRTRRGACLRCGYSREGLKAEAVCPECGLGGRITDAD